MTTNYLDSKRISGTTADRNGTPVVSGGWKEVGRATAGASGALNLDVTSIPDKRYYKILVNNIPSASMTPILRVGNGSFDSGNNYAPRWSANGGTDSTRTGKNTIAIDDVGLTTPNFHVGYAANIATKEKLFLIHSTGQSTAGAGTAPIRVERATKWSNTSSVIDQIQLLDEDGSGTDIGEGSEIIILGWDEDDTHTTNFWEELASVDISTGTTSTTGTFTAKKYLWVQVYMNSSSIAYDYTFNSDTGSNYAYRKSTNGGGDGETANDSVFLSNHGFDSNPHYDNFFIVNNSANEKLVIGNRMSQGTAGAGSAPNRQEIVGKWANTSSQITSIQMDNAGTNFTRCIMKVWGSD